MANISDLIEEFLLSTLGQDETMSISRNELANYFACAPSQINYVLATRFTPERGYAIESRRGGGGYITVVKISQPEDEMMNQLLNSTIAEGISYPRACQIVERLEGEQLLSGQECGLVKAILSDKALCAPGAVKDGLRASILKTVITEIMKRS